MRRVTLAALLSALLVAGNGPVRAQDAPAPAPAPPNVLLISIDTLRADHLSFLGYGRATTPHLDRLAERAVVFEDAHSSSSWTPPGAASFLTGLQPIRHGMIGGPVRIHPEAKTLAEMLRGAGYRTRAVVQNAWFAEEFGWSRGFEEYRDFDFIGNPLCEPVQERDVTDWLGVKSERPFFLWLNYFAPHCPYEPHDPWVEEYSPQAYSKWFESVEHIEMERFKGRILLPRDQARFEALYDSEINFVDRHVGRVLSALENSGKRENTIVVLLSDHGEEFKDHGSLGHYRTLHPELTHVPLVIALPGQTKPVRYSRPVGTVDTVPTLRTLLGMKALDALDGEPLLHRANGDSPASVASSLGGFDVRRAGRYVFSFRYAQGYEAFVARARLEREDDEVPGFLPADGGARFANLFCARDDRYTLLCLTGKNDLEESKTIDGKHKRADEIPFLTRGYHYRYRLYDRRSDPHEQDDVADQFPDVCKRMATALRDEFRRHPLRLPIAADGEIAPGSRADMSDETKEALKGLGYVK